MVTLVNRAKMSTATTGTGTITLGTAEYSYQTFADAGVTDGDVVRYVIEDDTAWEIGTGTYTASGTTLTRTVLESSNSDAAINLSGSALVFVTAAGADIQQPPSEGAFVDGDKTKLDGIEAGADVTDTTNVTAAGALMDSELTDIAAIKALNQGVATTDSPTFDGLTVDTNTLFVDAANNRVGIGTSSPAYSLDVSKTGGAIARFINGSSGGTPSNTHGELIIESGEANMGVQLLGTNTSNQKILFGDVTSPGSGQIEYNHASDNMALYTSTAERMRIDSTGKVGIGTSSPAAKLHSSISSSGASAVGVANVAGFFEAATSAAVQVTSGASSPAFLYMGNAADIDATRIAAQNGFTQISATGASNYIRFDAGGFSERMRINSSGNVGIGTSNPLAKLSVQTADLGTTAGDSIQSLSLRSDTSNADYMLFTAERISTGTSWTTAAHKMQRKVDSTLMGYMQFGGNSSDLITFGENATEYMRIDGSGKVGIGTSSPATALDVTGTVTATAFAGDGSSLTGIAAGATGGGSDEIFWENGQNVTTNYTITNGKNAMSAGPITIDSGVTVTVGAGETWTVV